MYKGTGDYEITMELNLQSRINLCKYCIELLQSVPGDPRQPDALKYYQAQLAELEAQVKPPPIVIGLKTASISGKVPKGV